MTRILTFIFTCCFVFCPADLRGEDGLSASPLFQYIKDIVQSSGPPDGSEGSAWDVFMAYPSIAEFQRDILLGLQSKNDDIRNEIFYMLNVIDFRRGGYDSIMKRFLSTQSVTRQLRLFNEQSPLMLMHMIDKFEIRSLRDIVFMNTAHEDPRVRQGAYMVLGHSVGNYDKRKARYYLRRGLKDKDICLVYFGSVSEQAAEACVRLGGGFRLLLWFHAPEYRYKLFE